MLKHQYLQNSIAPAIIIVQRNDSKKSSQTSIAPGIIIAKV